MKFLRSVSLVAASVLCLGLFSGCGSKEKQVSQDAAKAETNTENPVAIIILEDGRRIEVELYPDKVSNTVSNFIYLANTKHFYDGLIFHRIIKDFMIQGGCPQGTGMGGPDYKIKGEFSSNGFTQNDLRHVKGAISMARSQMKDSAGSQFFICVKDDLFLDGDYAAFGMTKLGLDIAVDISEVATNSNDKPLTPVKIASLRVDTHGKVYSIPTTVPQVK